MSKKCFLILIAALCFSLVGCGNAIPEMTEEQNSLVTSYAAGLLLKYDARYQSRLLNDEELAKEEELQRQIQEEAAKKAALEAEKEAKRQEEEAAKEAEKHGGTGEENIINANPADILGLNGLSVSYNGVDYMDSYPESGDELFFALQPSAGCKLAVVKLVITNESPEAKSADILSTNAKFKVSFNNGDYYNTMVTMLSDDFSVYSGEIQPGTHVNTVLLIDMKENECVPVESATLYIKYNGEAVKIKL